MIKFYLGHDTKFIYALKYFLFELIFSDFWHDINLNLIRLLKNLTVYSLFSNIKSGFNYKEKKTIETFLTFINDGVKVNLNFN